MLIVKNLLLSNIQFTVSELQLIFHRIEFTEEVQDGTIDYQGFISERNTKFSKNKNEIKRPTVDNGNGIF